MLSQHIPPASSTPVGLNVQIHPMRIEYTQCMPKVTYLVSEKKKESNNTVLSNTLGDSKTFCPHRSDRDGHVR